MRGTSLYSGDVDSRHGCTGFTRRRPDYMILAEHPDLESEDIRACLRFASERLNHPVLAA